MICAVYTWKPHKNWAVHDTSFLIPYMNLCVNQELERKYKTIEEKPKF